MSEPGRFLLVSGTLLVLAGPALWPGLGQGWPGRRPGQPGDIHIERGSFSFHFPLTTGLLISAVLTLLLGLFRR